MKNFWFLAFCALLLVRLSFAADTAPTVLLGQANAPVTIDEYASLGCPHCADFDLNTLPNFKKAYIDTGKAKLVFHYFPLDKASLDAALIVECVPGAQKWDAINLLYFQQDKWAHEMDYDSKLTGYGQMLGLSPDAIKACMGNQKMRDAILAGRLDATNKTKVEGTPTFIFNHGDTRLVGSQSFDQMVAVMNKL